MPANAHTSKKFTHMCFEKSEITSAEYQKKKRLKWLRVSNSLTSAIPLGYCFISI